MINLSDNPRNVSTFHESKLLGNPTFSHVLRDQTLGVNCLRIVNAHFFSILKILYKKRIEKNFKLLNFCNGHFVTLIGLGFFDMFRFFLPPLLSSLFVDLSQRTFVQGLTIEALAQIWKKFA